MYGSDSFRGGKIHGLTDTKLRNLQTLWLTKYREWGVDLNDKRHAAYQQWREMVYASLKIELGLKPPEGDEHGSETSDSEPFTVLHEMLDNGLLFDALELYLGIMKEKIGKKWRRES